MGTRARLRESVGQWARVDTEASRAIGVSGRSHAGPPTTPPRPTPVFEGLDLRTGMRHEFGHSDVISEPMIDSQGKVIGPIFLSKPGDAQGLSRWARAEQRTSDEYYFEGRQVPHPQAGQPVWFFDNPKPAPWADRTGRTPVYSFAHSSPDGVAVNVRTALGETTVRVDGATYGRILAANDHFRQAITGSGALTETGIPRHRHGLSNHPPVAWILRAGVAAHPLVELAAQGRPRRGIPGAPSAAPGRPAPGAYAMTTSATRPRDRRGTAVDRFRSTAPPRSPTRPGLPTAHGGVGGEKQSARSDARSYRR